MHYPQEHHTLGLPEMDTQHDYLYSLFARIPQSTAVGDAAAMRVLVDELERYILFHFASEEQLMRRYEFAGFAVHQGDHEQAGGKLVQFLDDFDAGRLNPAAMRIFLTGWLLEHSRSADEEYARWVKSRRERVMGMATS